MRAPVVLALLAVALLAALARAQEEPEDTIQAKMETYMQQATQRIKDTLASLDVTRLAQQSRQWASEHLDTFQSYLEQLKRTFTQPQTS
ncbi:PREDICTED: apolipoprotein C-III-like [Gavialis gangeticus]|uniref:apolipoprotein C-III-like n=1 Tax=Gavialis gangeticus TaxID=94835 RepID=UPI00092E6CD0|nr:PREDICTED: apolipoprotein C-III-like [Gavialis gangeticus]